MNRRQMMSVIWAFAGAVGVLGFGAAVQGSGGAGVRGGLGPGVEKAPGQIVLYCGRSRTLVDPLVERFERETGIDVAVRYGRDAQLVGAMAEEGSGTPADVFWANTTGALGAAVNQDLLDGTSRQVLGMPAVHIPAAGKWTPVTMRFRVLAYNPRRVNAEELPGSVMELPSLERFRGKIGWTPTYSSFQDFVTAMRVTKGDAATSSWLKGVKAMEPKSYSGNTAMMQALLAGEIDVALTNHYYVLRVKGQDADAPLEMRHFDKGDVGNLALVTGAGVVKGSTNKEGANRFLAFLLGADAQSFAAQQVNEYPVVSGIELPDHMTGAEESQALSPEFDMERLQELGQTLQLMQEAGLF